MDRSGSMQGTALQTGLLYLLIISVIFRVKEVIYFDDKVEVRKLTDQDLDGPILDLLKKIYTVFQGSTELIEAFKYLENNRIGDSLVVLFSDGDCNPDPSNSKNINAFHAAFNINRFKYLPTNQYIIMNVNEEMMRFPFMNFHERTCIITGTSTVVFLIEALIECSKNKTYVTPVMILQKCLNSKNFKLPDSIISALRDINRFDSTFLTADKYELEVLYLKWISDLPKKKEDVTVFNNIDMELYDPNDPTQVNYQLDYYTEDEQDDENTGISQEEEEESLRNYGSIPPVEPEDNIPNWKQPINSWQTGIPVQDSNGEWHVI